MRRLLVCLFVLFVATGAYAADPIFAVGFTGVQVKTISGGVIHYVEVQVSSNESDADAQPWDIDVGIFATSGRFYDQQVVSRSTKLRPPLRPLRFQVLYETVI